MAIDAMERILVPFALRKLGQWLVPPNESAQQLAEESIEKSKRALYFLMTASPWRRYPLIQILHPC